MTGNSDNRQSNWFWLLAALASVTVLGSSIWRGIPSGDESRVAGICMEMFVSGDWIVPRLNGEYFLEYPPLYYQLSALSMTLFGTTEWAVALPSYLAAILSCLVLYQLVKCLGFSDLKAFFAGVMLLTGVQFFDSSLKCMVDPLLAFFILLSVYCWTKWHKEESKLYYAGFCLALAGGIYTKGLIGAAMPGVGIGLFLIAEDLADKKFRLSRYLTAIAAGILAVGLAAVWVYLLYMRTGENMEAVRTVVVTNNFGRSSGSQGDHVENFWYYFIKLPSLFWPWLPLLPFAVFYGWRDRRRRLLVSLLLGGFAMLLAAAAKRQIYLLPLYAPAAGLCGIFALLLMEKYKIEAKRRYVIRLTGALGLVYLTIGLLIDRNENKDRLDELFEAAEGHNVYLLKCHAEERTRGAAFFYRRSRTEIIHAADLGKLKKGDVVIGRRIPENLPTNLKAEKYPDKHWLIEI